MVYLKNSNDQYVKDIDSVNGTLEFTSSEDEAKQYSGDWFADTELEYIKFHFKDYEGVDSLKLYWGSSPI